VLRLHLIIAGGSGSGRGLIRQESEGAPGVLVEFRTIKSEAMTPVSGAPARPAVSIHDE